MVSVVYLVLALVLSLAIIPQAMRLAPMLGMVDQPDARKVHAIPIARVGGIGIVAGAVIALSFAVVIDTLVLSYILGALVLFVFGVADDRFELGHYPKFLGQLIAVALVVIYGDLQVTRLPFLTEPLPETIAIPFTIFAMVGVINAFNHADGLDGLAGGEALLSLLAAAAIAYWSNDSLAFNIALVAIGGLVGFLRYNNHPARVFMGDAGSQYLGFTIAFLAVQLTQQGNTALSAALPALLIGLPIIDILTVFYLRISGGMHWFKASRNHFHHRLLDIGYVHAESVMVIYSVQLLFVVSAVTLRYHMDAVILLAYGVIIAAVFTALTLAERSGRRHRKELRVADVGLLRNPHNSASLKAIPVTVLATLLPIYFLANAGLVMNAVDTWFGVSALVMGSVLLMCVLLSGPQSTAFTRVSAYSGVLLFTYGDYQYTQGPLVLEIAFFVVMAITVVAAVKLNARDRFHTNPLDYLIAMLLLIILLFRREFAIDPALTALILKSVILLYSVEYLMVRGGIHAQVVRVTLGFALCMLAIRALI